MRHRVSALVLSLAGALPLVGCGGSGGGDSGPTVPGTLSAVAVEGASTPAGGVFGVLPSDLLVAVAPSGWVAFAADVVGGSTATGVFVARPNGALVLVWSKGETVPSTNGASGTLDDVERLWIRRDGSDSSSDALLVAHVTTSGGSGEVILTARISTGGSVSEKRSALALGRDLPDAINLGNVGALTALDEDATFVDGDADIFFHGTGTGGTPLHGVWKVSRLGDQIARVAVTGDTAPGGGTFGFDFPVIGADADGYLAAFACDVVGVAAQGVYATIDGSTYVKVAANGDTAPDTGNRTFASAWDGGPLLVSTGGPGTDGYVTWRGKATAPSPDHGVWTRQVLSAGVPTSAFIQSVVAPGESLSGVGGLVTDVTLWAQEPTAARITIRAELSGSPSGADHVFLSAGDPSDVLEMFRDGRIAPPGGATFGPGYPSLLHADLDDATSRGGSFAFSATLSDASTGVYWAVRNLGFFALATQGDPAPGTGSGTFGSFAAPSVVVTAEGVVAFVAPVVGGTGATALFRQG